ncbi:hypothetical protein [Salicibibacter halophilus]|uniref:hypothetical protein n=1 Tax=Salicibibacter halophilus TaxID=2502791 RepID=UPI003868AC9C
MDVIAPLLGFIFFIGMFLIPFLLYRSFSRREENNSKDIDKKLNRIIELLEQNKKE